MASQLQSLETFLGEPVPQVLPGSFVSRPNVSFSAARVPSSSSFSGWRSSMTSRLATMTRRLQPAKQESAELKKSRASPQRGVAVRKGGFKTQEGNNESSGDETACSDPSSVQCVCFDLTDSDDESDPDSVSDCTLSPCAPSRQSRHSIEAAFDDVRLLAACVKPEPWEFVAGACTPRGQCTPKACR